MLLLVAPSGSPSTSTTGTRAGNFFIDPVFNETVQIVEFDEGFDTETFFMYVCMAGAVVLLLFLGFNFLSGQST